MPPLNDVTDAPSKTICLAVEAAFQLGPVRVDPARRLLWASGRELLIEPRAMQVLVALAKVRGAVIGRDALIEQCWAGRVVGDDAIYRVIAQLREVAKASGRAFSIETIPKVGYRLIAVPGTACVGQIEEDVAPQSHGQSFGQSVGQSFDQNGSVTAASPAPQAATVKWTRRTALGAAVLGASALLLRGGYQQDDTRFDELIAQSENADRLAVPESYAKGVSLLEDAVRLRPTDPLGWGRLALALNFAAEFMTGPQLATAVAKLQTAARRALALEARQPDASSALAILPPFYGDWGAAQARLDAVLDNHPAHLPTRDARDFLFAAVGRMDEAATSRIGYAQADPLHARLAYRLIYAHWNLGQIEAADRVADRALHLWPMHPAVWFARLWTLAFTGRAHQAQAHLEEASARPVLPDGTLAVLRHSLEALATFAVSDMDRARKSVLAQVAVSPSAAINGVMTLSALGDIDTSFAIAEAYLLERGPLVAALRWRKGDASINDQHRRKTHMLFIPATVAMRSDPRFDRLMDDIGLTEYWQVTGVSPDHLKPR